MAKNLPAPENFRRHWEVQKRHSGALAPLLETLMAAAQDSVNSMLYRWSYLSGHLSCLSVNERGGRASKFAPKNKPFLLVEELGQPIRGPVFGGDSA